ncbi:hypothetical protein [Micromonospora sp. NBC_01796]|uniref:hypothetical protein n=1 Tax=Micromonospora sp. NBC_01796 TaxID=2975987 RepID=UPI002DDBB51A|nr:hypothetical protein [Micromonospora sp. NBC_01796]WSA89036.1 hypothetical protein OIE47_16275 [Micromonospora sp. NBC_01796]
MSTDAAVYPPPASPPEPGPASPRSRRRWLLVGVAAWAVLLLLVAYVSIRRDAPTVREQRDVVAALPVLRRAMGLLLAGAGSDPVVEISGPAMERGCRITPVRDGGELVGTITLRTAEAEAPALLDRVAEHLPDDYRARVRHNPTLGTHTLRADAGEFVAIYGDVTDPGVVELTAESGCRPVPANFDFVENMMGLPIDAEPGRVLAALGLAAPTPAQRVGSIPCPTGGLVHTATASAPGTPTPAALRALPPQGATIITADPNLHAYRTPTLSVVITLTPTQTQTKVQTTTPCP